MSDGCFHRRGKAHRLAVFREYRRDALDGRKKSHVQHAVCFVEDQDAQRVEIEKLAIQVIFQAARSSDNYAGSLADGIELRAFRQSANHEPRGHKLRAAQCVELRHHLHGQFPRWHQHQRRNSGRFALQQLLDHRDQERQRLAGSGLRGCEHVLALERLRNGRSLHRGRRRKSRVCQSLFHVGGDR